MPKRRKTTKIKHKAAPRAKRTKKSFRGIFSPPLINEPQWFSPALLYFSLSPLVSPYFFAQKSLFQLFFLRFGQISLLFSHFNRILLLFFYIFGLKKRIFIVSRETMIEIPFAKRREIQSMSVASRRVIVQRTRSARCNIHAHSTPIYLDLRAGNCAFMPIFIYFGLFRHNF